MNTISQKELALDLNEIKRLLDYCPATGVFTWRITFGRATAGARAGNINSNGYWVLGIGGEKIRQHRLAWFYMHGRWPVEGIDHRDTDRTNNRIGNLRDVPQPINLQNMRKATAASKSGVLGVHWSGRRGGYMAAVTTTGKQKRKGPYKSIERATDSYIAMKRKYHEGCTL